MVESFVPLFSDSKIPWVEGTSILLFRWFLLQLPENEEVIREPKLFNDLYRSFLFTVSVAEVLRKKQVFQKENNGESDVTRHRIFRITQRLCNIRYGYLGTFKKKMSSPNLKER